MNKVDIVYDVEIKDSKAFLVKNRTELVERIQLRSGAMIDLIIQDGVCRMQSKSRQDFPLAVLHLNLLFNTITTMQLPIRRTNVAEWLVATFDEKEWLQTVSAPSDSVIAIEKGQQFKRINVTSGDGKAAWEFRVTRPLVLNTYK